MYIVRRIMLISPYILAGLCALPLIEHTNLLLGTHFLPVQI